MGRGRGWGGAGMQRHREGESCLPLNLRLPLEGGRDGRGAWVGRGVVPGWGEAGRARDRLCPRLCPPQGRMVGMGGARWGQEGRVRAGHGGRASPAHPSEGGNGE